jgi:hypothetical protein
MAPHQHDSSRELDELIHSSRRSFITSSDASFDFDAGLADVYERSGRLMAQVPASPPGGGGGPLEAAVAAACEHIDDFVALLGQVMLAGSQPELIGSQVQRAAEVLLQVREHVAGGSLSQAAAADAFAAARDALAQADLVVSVERGQSLDDALNASHAALLRRLEHEVANVLTPDRPSTDPAARSRRRRSDSPPSRRRAEGSGR